MSNDHVHIVVSVVPSLGNQEWRGGNGVKRVRDQFKANATRVLRQGENSIRSDKVWTKGGDIEFADSEADLERVVLYVAEAQDRMDRREW